MSLADLELVHGRDQDALLVVVLELVVNDVLVQLSHLVGRELTLLDQLEVPGDETVST